MNPFTNLLSTHFANLLLGASHTTSAQCVTKKAQGALTLQTRTYTSTQVHWFSITQSGPALSYPSADSFEVPNDRNKVTQSPVLSQRSTIL
jgi:hypothetical protein